MIPDVIPEKIAHAKPAESFSAPESFSSLAEKASPAVVNIRTVKTIKGGGRVFRHFKKGPFGEDDPMRDFFDRFLDEDQNRDFKQRSLAIVASNSFSSFKMTTILSALSIT